MQVAGVAFELSRRRFTVTANSMSTVGELYARRITVSERACPNASGKVASAGGFDRSRTYLFEGLSPVPDGVSASGKEKRFVSRILERTFDSLFALVERLFNADVWRVSGDHGLGDQVALEARVRFSDEEFARREPAGSRRRPHSGECS